MYHATNEVPSLQLMEETTAATAAAASNGLTIVLGHAGSTLVQSFARSLPGPGSRGAVLDLVAGLGAGAGGGGGDDDGGYGYGLDGPYGYGYGYGYGGDDGFYIGGEQVACYDSDDPPTDDEPWCGGRLSRSSSSLLLAVSLSGSERPREPPQRP